MSAATATAAAAVSPRPDIEVAVRAALGLLEHTSDSSRNGNPCESRPLHWPVAVREAKRALTGALEALVEPPPSTDGATCDSATCATGRADEPVSVLIARDVSICKLAAALDGAGLALRHDAARCALVIEAATVPPGNRGARRFRRASLRLLPLHPRHKF